MTGESGWRFPQKRVYRWRSWDSWLRAKLGHETSLSIASVRTQSGITLTARAGTEGAVSVSGPDADMTALTGKLAEAVYRLTQPYRYAIYLIRHEKRPADAAAIFGELALHGSPEERRWSYNMWANATEIATHDYDLGLRSVQKAHQADPDAIQPISALGQDHFSFWPGQKNPFEYKKRAWQYSVRPTRLSGSPNIRQLFRTIWLGGL